MTSLFLVRLRPPGIPGGWFGESAQGDDRDDLWLKMPWNQRLRLLLPYGFVWKVWEDHGKPAIPMDWNHFSCESGYLRVYLLRQSHVYRSGLEWDGHIWFDRYVETVVFTMKKHQIWRFPVPLDQFHQFLGLAMLADQLSICLFWEPNQWIRQAVKISW